MNGRVSASTSTAMPIFAPQDRAKIFRMDPIVLPQRPLFPCGVVFCGTFGRGLLLNPLSSLAWYLDQLIEREGRGG